MDRARAGTGFGINPIAWQEIDAWARCRKVDPSQWEIDALISLDSLRMELFYAAKGKDNADEPQVSERPLTSRLFDALFPKKRK
ncbi:hypothetical protein ELH06_08560 [Rhizobium ruizarguesonis]|uniref:phage tail assembly chaperone n=1 Tax=Rhizobium ruizarguesonis TaxID=2081791 RepID=UPI00102FA562|nr:hypothetical protein [Rhizobium ruizarguesonis]TBE49209.1 hypothetical protein ELH06_08560 [Rhizobium ruizarguesonis]TBF08724.1 hypothetical protein ELG96_08400 [Rhizobium ruizarguesonis]